MRGFRLFERPVGAFSTLPLLQVVGTLPPYGEGQPYEGRLDILGAVGRCHVEIVEEASHLPTGSYVHVDNFNQQVVLKWPAYHPPAPVEDDIINGDFQEGVGGWADLQGNSWEVRKYEDDDTDVGPGDRPRPAGNLAAWMTGAGRGDHILESIKYPVHPGQGITARALWDQGPSNKDNNNLFTALGLYRGGSFIEQVLGDRIHGRTNRTRHWSTVNHVIQPGINEITIRLIAHRRNGRNRPIIVDDVEVSGLTYSAGQDGPDEVYTLTLRLRDSANRQATWSGDIEPTTIPTYSLMHFDTGFDDVYGIEWEPSANASISTNNPRFGAGCFESLSSNNWVRHIAPEGVLLQDSSTVEGWVRLSTYGRVHGIIHIRNHSVTGATQQVSIRTMSDGRLRFQDRGNSTSGFTYTHDTPLPLDEWVHVALCFESEGESGGSVLPRVGYAFINGELVHSEAAAAGLGRLVPLQVSYGHFRDGTVNQYLRGALDEWRIVNGECLYTESFDPPTAPYPM